LDKVRIINAGEVKQVLSMEKAIEGMRSAFIQFSTGKAVNPVRTNISFAPSEGDALFMPSYLSGDKKAGVKAITLIRDNYKRDLPFIHALVLLFNSETGQPEALINGEAITAIRTGAASGLATELLANKDAESIVIIGAGVQALTQFESVCTVRNIKRCLVFDVNKDKVDSFIDKANSLFPIEFKTGIDKKEILDYDIVCTTSNAAGVLFDDKDVKNGAHINAIGAYRPDMIEIPGKTVARSLTVVDSREAALAEAGDIIQAIKSNLIESSHIHCELGELAAGLKPGRISKDQVTLFKSVGLAVQDLAAASLIYNECVKLNIGTEIEL